MVFLSPPSSATQGANTHDDGCIVVAYTFDGYSHYSMVQTDALVIGTRVLLEESCAGEFAIIVNGFWSGNLNGSGSVAVPVGINEIRLQSDNLNVTFSNVTFYDSQPVFHAVNPPTGYSPDSEWLSPEQIQNSEMMVAFGTGIIVWALVTSILWRFVNTFVDKNLCEEVVA